MSYSHSSSEGSDAESDTSSLVYGHEPFSTFCERALDFAKCQIWPDAAQHEVTVDRMAGGSFNRVINLRREMGGAQGEEVTEYILRIPRYDNALAGNIAALQFVRHYTSIPAPDIVRFDETEANVLGCQFSVQTRIDGVRLLENYQALSHNAKCSVARCLGDVYRQMLAIESSTAGILTFGDGESRLDTSFYIVPVETGNDPVVDHGASEDPSPTPVMYDTSPATTSSRSVMIDAFQAQKARRIRWSGEDSLSARLCEDFCNMATEMEAQSWLPSENYSLAHLDLEPHNILLKMVDDDDNPCIISGILDWDESVLGPKFVSCKPPMWLWAWNEEDQEDERLANDCPVSPELQQVKQTFEDAAGPDYLRYAYQPVYRLARQLFKFAVHDVRSNEDITEAWQMLAEWKQLYIDKSELENLT